MASKAVQIQCSEKERAILMEWSRSRTIEARMVERAKIILGCLDERPIKQIARELKIRPNTAIEWRHVKPK